MSLKEKQKNLILKKNWDNLIILDACRFDYFAKTYHQYFEGNLRMVKSSGTNTPTWLRETFEKYNKNLVYVSANPYCNSKLGIEGFSGKDIFLKVFDVWDFGYDENLNTIPPRKVSKATRKAKAKYPDKKIISHYVQPHYPYLNSEVETGGGIGNLSTNGGRGNRIFSKIGKFLSELTNPRLAHKVGRLLNLNSKTILEKTVEKYGRKKLQEAYRKNLETVFESVKDLHEELPGKMIITSDHGELLGEDGMYSHHSHHPLLKKVPWFEVEKTIS